MSGIERKLVNKPWGKEVWLEVNDKYCFKAIHLRGGCQTSFQYHKRKLESSYVVSGRLEVSLENETGKIEILLMNPGDSYTVQPLRKHRVMALEDSVYIETSTPEVDDIIRIQDNYSRPDGRIESEHSGYK